MLTSDQFDALVEPIVALYTEYEDSVIQDIARRLAKLDFASAAWQVQRLTESGMLYKDTLKKLAKLSGKSEKELRAIFKEAGVKALKFDDQIYKAAGLNPLPLNLSPAMAQVLAAGLRKTQGILSNLTMTTALTGQQAFIRASDLAYMQVVNGAMSYDQAIRAAVKKLAAEGLSVVNYTGRRDHLDVATRRTVLTGVAQTTGNLQMFRADEVGSDLVQTSAHIGARPTHEPWQGKVFSRSGNHAQYPDFVSSTGYGTVTGLMGVNCRHSFFPYFEGISENVYNQEELNAYARKTVTYNGQSMPIYEATQYQRGIERQIRFWKRQSGALQAAGLNNSLALAKIKAYQAKMRSFIKQTGLDRQPVREGVILPSNPKRDLPPAPKPIKLPPAIEPVPNVNADVPGVPVSNALDLSKVTKKPMLEQINLALKELDKVHGDGELPRILVTQSGAGRNYGVFQYSFSGTPVKIAISPKGDHQALTMLHEVGHFLDHSATGRNRWTSQFSNIDHGLIVAAAKKSKWWTGFAERVAAVTIRSEGAISLSRQYLSYIRNDKELFARAYAQFIAMESGDPILLAQLKSLQEWEFPVQWSDDDFALIADEFRKLFRERGWMK